MSGLTELGMTACLLVLTIFNCIPGSLSGDVHSIVGNTTTLYCTFSSNTPTVTWHSVVNNNDIYLYVVNGSVVEYNPIIYSNFDYEEPTSTTFNMIINDLEISNAGTYHCSLSGDTIEVIPTTLYLEAAVSSISITCNSPCIIDNDTVSAIQGKLCDCSCIATNGYPQGLDLLWNLGNATNTVIVDSTQLPGSYNFSNTVAFTPSLSNTTLSCHVDGYDIQEILETEKIKKELHLDLQSIVSSISITCNSPCTIADDTVPVIEGISCDCYCTAKEGYPQDLNLIWNFETATDTEMVNSTQLPGSYDFTSNITFTPSSGNTTLSCYVHGYTNPAILDSGDIKEELNLDVKYPPSCTLEDQSSGGCEDITFKCNCISNPNTTKYDFFLEDVNITSSMTNTVTTKFLTTDVDYILYCIGYNDINEMEKSGTSEDLIYQKCKTVSTTQEITTEEETTTSDPLEDNTALIIGCSVAGGVIVLVVLFVIIYCCFIKKDSKDDGQDAGVMSTNLSMGVKEMDPPVYAAVNKDKKSTKQPAPTSPPTAAARNSSAPAANITYADLDLDDKPESSVIHQPAEPTMYASVGEGSKYGKSSTSTVGEI